MSNKTYVFLVSLLICVAASRVQAEIISCKASVDSITTDVTIQPEWINDGMGKYLYITIKNDATQFGDRLNLHTMMKRKVLRNKIQYFDYFRSNEVNMELLLTGQKDIFTGSIKLYSGKPYQKTISGLTCSSTGEFYPPVSPCPAADKANAALIKGAKYGSPEDIERALECGADPDFKDENGCTALLLVTDLGCGYRTPNNRPSDPADPSAPESPAYGPRSSINIGELIKTLLNGGANYEARNPISRETPLINTVKWGLFSQTFDLLQFGANVDTKNANGDTPLMYAANSGSQVMVRTVLGGDPDLSLKNNQGQTAYDIASKKGFEYLLADLEPGEVKVVVEGKEDGTCAPTMIHLMKGKSVELSLKAGSKMFLFQAKDFNIDLMAMPNETAKKVFRPNQTGNYPFKCGVHGGSTQTNGTIMVM